MQDDIISYLANEWDGLMAAAQTSDRDSTSIFHKIIQTYSEPHRFYHTLDHIAAMMEQAEMLQFADPVSVRMAILYHDLIYFTDPATLTAIKSGILPINEEQSARVAEADMMLMDFDPAVISRTAHMIRLTSRHELSVDDNQDTALFLDMDLSIFGAPAAQYDLYAAGLYKEYADFDQDLFFQNRLKFIERKIQSEKIFNTDLYTMKYDIPARANLSREQRVLESGGVAILQKPFIAATPAPK